MLNGKREANACPPHITGLKKPLGVIGGMESLATAKFLQALAQKSGGETDREHVPFIALSLPNISDRSHAISIASDAPLRQILERAQWLEKVGCGAIAIPCNTAHFWSSDIANALTINFISMVEVTRDFIHQHNGTDIDNLRTIVLGMEANIQRKLYGHSAAGWGGAVPDVDSIQQDATRVIDDVKSGNISRARFKMALLVARTRSLKPDAVILGCSELSSASRDIFKGTDVIDPVDVLVDACILWFRNS
ncbi:aspartate/glutamate racemase family protein [Rhizobium laguerreae]|uniref:aspartate/glutamate racemase family protein n=1 Tax=Rhizobium laguerreae TaxID=1076926 RepID=UPI0035E43BB4